MIMYEPAFYVDAAAVAAAAAPAAAAMLLLLFAIWNRYSMYTTRAYTCTVAVPEAALYSIISCNG